MELKKEEEVALESKDFEDTGVMREAEVTLKKLGYMVGSGLTFARLFLLPTESNTMPDQVRMQPAW